ncbi:MAG: 50S ribosomal protein L21 [Minisyncoccia bacterium]
MVKEKAQPKAKKASSVPAAKNSQAVFAVFTTGGKQYRVSKGETVKIEKLPGNYKEGDKLVFDKVLMLDDGKSWADIGAPYIENAEVNTTLKKIGRHKTVDVIKYKQKSRYFKKYGHRQPYFEVKVDSIT